MAGRTSYDYSWANTLYRLDRNSENYREYQAYKAILDEKADEDFWTNVLDIPAKVVGHIAGSFFGMPAEGAKLADFVTERIVDRAHDWESGRVPEGKFAKKKSAEINEDIESWAKEDFLEDVINAGTDLLSIYSKHGGWSGQKAVDEWNEANPDDPISFWEGYAHTTDNPQGIEAPKIQDFWADSEAYQIKGTNIPIPFSRTAETLWDYGGAALGLEKNIDKALIDDVLTNIIGNQEQYCISMGGIWKDDECFGHIDETDK